MFLNKLSKIRFCFKHFLNAFAEKSVMELGCGVSVPSAKKCKLFATPNWPLWLHLMSHYLE